MREELKKFSPNEEKELREVSKTEMCAEQSMADMRSAIDKPPLISEKERRYGHELLARQKRFCEQPTWATLHEFLRVLNDWDSKTCRIWTNAYTETFEWQPSGKWVSNRGPSGICGVIVVSTLEPHDKTKFPVRWTYETRKIVTNKDALKGDVCKFEETPVRYSWRGPGQATRLRIYRVRLLTCAMGNSARETKRAREVESTTGESGQRG
jgi:hypothetical protein